MEVHTLEKVDEHELEVHLKMAADLSKEWGPLRSRNIIIEMGRAEMKIAIYCVACVMLSFYLFVGIAFSSDGVDPVVQALQIELAKQGYSVGVVDGLSGPATTRALKAFQKSMEVLETGELDKATLLALATVWDRDKAHVHHLEIEWVLQYLRNAAIQLHSGDMELTYTKDAPLRIFVGRPSRGNNNVEMKELSFTFKMGKVKIVYKMENGECTAISSDLRLAVSENAVVVLGESSYVYKNGCWMPQ